MIKNIIFDIGNVLVEFGWNSFFRRFTDSEEIFERMCKATVLDPGHAWNEIDRAVLSEEEVLELFIKNDPGIEKELRAMYKDFNGLLVQYDYTREWIKDLQNRGYKVYCLSNMSFKSVRENADSMDFIPMLDGAVLSCYYQLCKPDREIYELLLNKYNLVAEECVFFDDLERNIKAANECGIHGVVFTGKDEAERALEELNSL